MHTHNAYFSKPIIYTLLFLSLAFQGCNDTQIREPSSQPRQCERPVIFHLFPGPQINML